MAIYCLWTALFTAKLSSIISTNRVLMLLVMMAIIILIGMFMDFTPTILILTPVLLPVVIQAGIDPVYFGILFIMNNAIGLLTPPAGNVLNVVRGIAQLPMNQAIAGLAVRPGAVYRTIPAGAVSFTGDGAPGLANLLISG